MKPTTQLSLFESARRAERACRRRSTRARRGARAWRPRCRPESTLARAPGASPAGRDSSTPGAERPRNWLAKGCEEYAQHPLLTTVGIDRSYYAPLPIEDSRPTPSSCRPASLLHQGAGVVTASRSSRAAAPDRREIQTSCRWSADGDLLEPLGRLSRPHRPDHPRVPAVCAAAPLEPALSRPPGLFLAELPRTSSTPSSCAIVLC